VYRRPQALENVRPAVENFSKLQDSIYFHDDQSLFVNLFIPSALDWREKGVTIRQETQFPDQDTSQLVFRCERPTAFKVRVRKPHLGGRAHGGEN
jgi:uncharacterized protein